MDAAKILQIILHGSLREICVKFACGMGSNFVKASMDSSWIPQSVLHGSLREICVRFAWSRLDLMPHADFTLIKSRRPCRMLWATFAESMGNRSMPTPCLIPCCIHLLRKFNAHFTYTAMQNAKRNLCRIYAESIYALSRLHLMHMQISRKFHADFTQTSMQNTLCNLCGILAEPIYP